MLDDLVAQDGFIDSCKMVLDKVRTVSSKPNTDSEFRKLVLEDLTEWEVQTVMKDKGLRYKKVAQIAMSANSERSLVLRQQWALKMLQQNPKNKVLINLDETWLGKCANGC